MILIYMQCRVLRGWGYAARMIFSSCLWETAEDIFRYLACSANYLMKISNVYFTIFQKTEDIINNSVSGVSVTLDSSKV